MWCDHEVLTLQQGPITGSSAKKIQENISKVLLWMVDSIKEEEQ